MQKIKVGIVGAAGYTGGELLRLLVFHPQVEIVFAQSRSNAGKKIADVHTDLLGETEACFCNEVITPIDVIFLCLSHGEASTVIKNIPAEVKIIDLSQDFRLQSPIEREFVYGLPELHKANIEHAQNIANPGCFATAIQLALLPLAVEKKIQAAVTVHCTTGSTGAGQSLSDTSHFSWRQNNLSVYKAFTHQHTAEIKRTIFSLQPELPFEFTMIPQRGSFTRGILACVSLQSTLELEALYKQYVDFYQGSPFVVVSKQDIDLKQVVNTNKCFLQLQKQNDQLLIVSVIDNLLKGAAGQAVQNMNLMFGIQENSGLKLKASAF